MRINSTKLISMRQQSHWTQEELATASGVSVRTIQRLETGNTGSPSSLKAICAAFDIEIDALIMKPIDRSWVFGPIIGMMGGAIGCGFGYWSIFIEAEQTQHSLADYRAILSFVSFMLAFSILFPSYMIYKNWNRTYVKRSFH